MKAPAFLRHPALQLLLIGGALFLAERVLMERAPPAPPTPVLIDRATQARLVDRWQRETGRAATAAEVQALLRQHADEEILVREALARDYARRDPVVRQRLIDNLRFVQPQDPRSDAALLREALALGMAGRDLVARRRLVLRLQTALAAEALAAPVAAAPDAAPAAADTASRLIGFTHRYYREAEAARAALAALPSAGTEATPPGEPFLLAPQQPPQPQTALAARWGEAFAAALQAAPVGVWTGPVASAWGWHLLRVDTVQDPAPDPAQALRSAEWRRQQLVDRALRRQLHTWRQQHPLVVERTS